MKIVSSAASNPPVEPLANTSALSGRSLDALDPFGGAPRPAQQPPCELQAPFSAGTVAPGVSALRRIDLHAEVQRIVRVVIGALARYDLTPSEGESFESGALQLDTSWLHFERDMLASVPCAATVDGMLQEAAGTLSADLAASLDREYTPRLARLDERLQNALAEVTLLQLRTNASSTVTPLTAFEYHFIDTFIVALTPSRPRFADRLKTLQSEARRGQVVAQAALRCALSIVGQHVSMAEVEALQYFYTSRAGVAFSALKRDYQCDALAGCAKSFEWPLLMLTYTNLVVPYRVPGPLDRFSTGGPLYGDDEGELCAPFANLAAPCWGAAFGGEEAWDKSPCKG